MMGQRQVAQGALFYEFSIEDHVPLDHLLRAMDRLVDLGDMRRHLAPFYSSTGRPSVDPELMIRMLIVGYAFGIRSERRLCEEVHLNLAYRWFCRLDLSDPVPDHSTFSKNRHGRFRDSDLFRHLFESVVARCISEGLVGGQTFASDASLIRADANKQYAAAKADWDPGRIDVTSAPRAVREYLEVLDEAAFGAATEVEPKFTSFADPASQWTGARKGPAFFAYARYGPPHRNDGRLRRCQQTTKEGRDALRPSQTHSSARPVAPPRIQRRQRRVPPRCNRPKPPETRETDPWRPGDGLSERPSQAHPQSNGDQPIEFFNTISPQRLVEKAPISGQNTWG
jgi:transposase